MAYGASKAGLISLTKNLARALAPQARVNAVAPGFVDTEWTQPWPEARKQASIERTLLKRACTPADIAGGDRVPVRRRRHGHGPDAGGGRRLFAVANRPYKLRPSKGVGLSVPMSTSSRQRTLTAIISLPVRRLSRAKMPRRRIAHRTGGGWSVLPNW